MQAITVEISHERVGVGADGTRRWGAEEHVGCGGKLRLRKFDVVWRAGEGGVLTFRPTRQTMRVAVVERGNTYYRLRA